MLGQHETDQRVARLRLIVFDFDGVMTDNGVYVFSDGTEAVRCNRSDGIGLKRVQRAGLETMILSTETDPVVSVRARKLGLPCLQGVEDKLSALLSIAQEKGLSLDEIAFVGNDINDRPCLTQVGFPVVVADAHDDLSTLAAYRTRRPGGHGAVREICDMIAELRRTPAAYPA